MSDPEKINILGCCGGHEEHLDHCARVELADLDEDEAYEDWI